jgi:DNA repair protein SbcC/Rad50
MRPLLLSMSAFGPFASVETIDFRALGSNPLFLINGPTGAGKTTILDGICFALYGKTTGNEREGSQMRCDMADEALLTEVSFSFILGDAQYRIRRVPEQERVKKSGEGSTVQKSEAQLVKIAVDGTETLLVATKVSEATAEIEALTGLDADQFRQVMVLPQGKFRELLMADSKAREKIFGQLFQTQIYRRIEERLKDSAADIRARVKDQLSRREGMLQSANVSGDEALLTELSEICAGLEVATADKALANQRVIKSRQDLDGANQLAAAFARLEKLQQEASQLAARQPEIAAVGERLQWAKKAQRVAPLLDSMNERMATETRAAANLAKANEAERIAKAALAQVQAKYGHLAGDERKLLELEQQKQALMALVPKLETFEQLTADTARLGEAMALAKQQGTESKQALATLTLTRQTLEAKLPQLQQQVDAQLALQQSHSQQLAIIERFQRWQLACERVAATQTRLDSARDKGLVLAGVHQGARLAHKALQLGWHRGQAAVLALELKEDEPCPVCGSQNHPQPAISDVEIPSEASLAKAQREENDALAALSQAREQYKLLKLQLATQASERDELEGRLSGQLGECDNGLSGLTLASLQQELSRLEVALDAARKSANSVTQLQQEIRHYAQQEEARVQRLEVEREQYGKLSEQHAQLSGQLEQVQAAIPESHRSLARLSADILALTAKTDQLAQHIATIRRQHHDASQAMASAFSALSLAATHAQEARDSLESAQRAFNERLGVAGFDSEAALREAMLTEEEAIEAERALEQYRQQVAVTESHLASLTEELKDRRLPDVPQLTSVMEQRVLELQSVEAQWQRLHTRKMLLQQTLQHLQEADHKAKALEDKYAVIGTLADVANGNTGNKISLQRFVLSVLLDDVLLQASHRLQLMSKGRYRLLRKEDRAKGNKASGLELEVEDAYSSKIRPVATLSGGESFMAALSMALGLSDVVQAYAGGIKLDTLFIDEGFGSLDPESLELAIRTLMDLQSAGRTIGVISHVAEMKEQIGTRIDIQKTGYGSETRIVLP